MSERKQVEFSNPWVESNLLPAAMHAYLRVCYSDPRAFNVALVLVPYPYLKNCRQLHSEILNPLDFLTSSWLQ